MWPDGARFWYPSDGVTFEYDPPETTAGGVDHQHDRAPSHGPDLDHDRPAVIGPGHHGLPVVELTWSRWHETARRPPVPRPVRALTSLRSRRR